MPCDGIQVLLVLRSPNDSATAAVRRPTHQLCSVGLLFSTRPPLAYFFNRKDTICLVGLVSEAGRLALQT